MDVVLTVSGVLHALECLSLNLFTPSVRWLLEGCSNVPVTHTVSLHWLAAWNTGDFPQILVGNT